MTIPSKDRFIQGGRRLCDPDSGGDVFERTVAFAVAEEIESQGRDAALVQEGGEGFIGRAVFM